MRERIAHLLAKFTAQEKPGTEAPIEFEVTEKPDVDEPEGH
jgi:acetyl-CoA carboxylase carboxyl transferase subunit beta